MADTPEKKPTISDIELLNIQQSNFIALLDGVYSVRNWLMILTFVVYMVALYHFRGKELPIL